MKYKDIYTEAPANPDTLSMLGPIAPLAGKWFGDDGVDTHPQAVSYTHLTLPTRSDV